MSFLGQEEQLREYQERFKYLFIALFIGLSLLVARLIFLQILSGDTMRRYSEENRIKRVKIASPRGMIFDRNRTLLIDNRPSFDLEITPQYLRGAENQQGVLERLSKLIDMPPDKIQKKLRSAAYQPAFVPVKIKTDLSRDEVAKIESWRIDMPGINVAMEIQRTNLYKDVASHLMGYIGELTHAELPIINRKKERYKLGDNIGKVGIEKQMENSLRGEDGVDLVEVDALGRRIREKKRGRLLGDDPSQPATPGKNLILTIDQDLQLVATKAFEDKIGGLVAIDPRNGEILAMVSRPSFDPTEFSRGISSKRWKKLISDEHRPLRDKTLQDHYSPGSVFKVVTSVAGLEEGLITGKTKFNCPGAIRVGNRLYHCHRAGGHGEVDVVEAIAKSCDVFFYRLAQKFKSVDQISKWAFLLGLGHKTGINLSREVPGLIPTEEWKDKRLGRPWQQGETLSVAIGQSFVLTTVLQLANMYAAIGNGGTLFKPFYLKGIESHEGEVLEEFGPQVIKEVKLHPETVKLVTKGLWGVVNTPGSTAYFQRIPGIDFVGKTGTVQLIRLSADKIYQKCEEMKFRFRHNAVFAGYAPADNPVIAVAVIAEHACAGSTGAAPIARQVVEAYLRKNYPELFKQESHYAGSGPILKGNFYPISQPQGDSE